MLLLPRSNQLVVSYGELDCYSTIARFPLGEVISAAHGRRHPTPAAPLLSILMLVGAVDGEGTTGSERADAAEGSHPRTEVGAMLRLMRSISASTSDGGLSHHVTLLLTERCDFPDAVGVELDLLGYRVVTFMLHTLAHGPLATA